MAGILLNNAGERRNRKLCDSRDFGWLRYGDYFVVKIPATRKLDLEEIYEPEFSTKVEV